MNRERTEGAIGPAEIVRIVDELAEPLALHAAQYPRTGPDRQPIHTVAGGPHLYRRDSATKLGAIALQYLAEYAPTPESLGALGLEASLATQVYERVLGKLEHEPVECFLIDFEDGFGNRSDEEEDEAAERAAAETIAGLLDDTLPPFLGLRVKALSDLTASRALRTLDLFLTSVVRGTDGRLPNSFFVILPKIVRPEQVAILTGALDRAEQMLGLPHQTIALELMIETPQALVRSDGAFAARGLVEAADGRCRTVHLGALDLTASASVTAVHQSLSHPLCDVSRQVLQLSLAETAVALSDGVTHLLPVGPHRPAFADSLSVEDRAENRAAVLEGWQRHCEDVRRALSQGFYQSWDLHPAQLVSRYIALYGFFLEELEETGQRLDRFLSEAAQATLSGGVFDDAATGQGLLNFFLRGLSSGALTRAESESCGLSLEDLESRSFLHIVEHRRQ